MRRFRMNVALRLFVFALCASAASLAQTPYPCASSSTTTPCLTVTSQGWIVGEIKQFAFGGDSQDLVKQLAAQGWVECAGQSLIRKDFDTLWKVIGPEWGSADKTNVFYLPDLRGMFLRGWNHSRQAPPKYPTPPYRGDVDLGDRIAPRPEAGDAGGASGATQDHVGSVQADMVGPHTHTYTTLGSTYQVAYAQSDQVFWGKQKTADTGTSTGVETHPDNAYVAYMIYVGKPVTFVPFDKSVSRNETDSAKKELYRTGWIDCTRKGCTSHKAK